MDKAKKPSPKASMTMSSIGKTPRLAAAAALKASSSYRCRHKGSRGENEPPYKNLIRTRLSPAPRNRSRLSSERPPLRGTFSPRGYGGRALACKLEGSWDPAQCRIGGKMSNCIKALASCCTLRPDTSLCPFSTGPEPDPGLAILPPRSPVKLGARSVASLRVLHQHSGYDHARASSSLVCSFRPWRMPDLPHPCRGTATSELP